MISDDGIRISANGLEKVLGGCLISTNEADQNGEVANVVDGLFAIARALQAIATAINLK